jgi:mRNA interferase MazF
MYKDFNTWNTKKRKINDKIFNRELFFRPGELWECSFGINIGVEIDGKHEDYQRPALIIKKFNGDMLWVLPLTTKFKNTKYHHKLHSSSIDTYVVLSQIRTISSKRLLRRIGRVAESDFGNIIKKLTEIINNESPLAGAFSEAEATNE